MKLQAEWRDRLRYWTHTLTQDFYTPLGEIEFEGFTTFERMSQADALKESFSPMPTGTKWGEEWQYAWLKAAFTMPAEAQGKLIVMDLNPGGESTLFLNGEEFGTRRAEWVTVPHHYMQDNIIAESGMKGNTYELLCEAYAGHYFPEGVGRGVGVGPVLPGAYEDPLAGKLRAEIGRSTFGVWNEDAYQLWLDVVTLSELLEHLSDGSLRAAKIAKGLKDFTLAVDFEQAPELRATCYKTGREILRPLMEAKNGSTAPTYYGIGNSHLDVVWLWPYQETIRKTARTFAQQLRLIERYPGYKYLQSQPQTYQMCKESYPELYGKIKRAVQDGRWIPEGAMWVEPDTNMSSGESLIRQLLHGMKFFKEEFGVDCEVLWLPDSFGYSAVLPQILKSFGIKYLVTQKIFWSYNEGEQFPYHYFTWQGNDGSEIISYLPTSYTYKTNPGELVPLWENRVQKDEMDKFLLPYGYGDGGGGPTRDHIEFAQRQADLEGAPKFKQAHPIELFRDLEADGGPVHKYTGELYFSAHRGVYTSQASVKQGNRKSEFALREAEMWAAIASAEGKRGYPAERLDAAWKKVLLCQFHDILPGSSIGRAYKEASLLHNEVVETGNGIAKESASAIAGESDNISIFNSLSWDRLVMAELPERFKNGARTAGGEQVETEAHDGKVLVKAVVPSCGCLVLEPAENAAAITGAVGVSVSGGGAVLENGKLRAEFNENGELISFVLSESGREFVDGAMNKFLLYKDVPRVFDAWDIDSMYEQQPVELDPKAEIKLVSQSKLKTIISIEKVIGNSKLRQLVSLASESDCLQFDTTVDWRELHRLLKVSFPVNVRATEGINEIQFGYMKRPTHRSRQYDKDRFEVCNHKYTALCDEGHGAAVLNDCKYGVSMLDNAINLTLLKAAGSPELRADNRVHSFTYAFTAWEGGFTQSDAARRGYELNSPVNIVQGGSESKSFFSVNKPNIIIETVKLAEDGSGDLILRLYEAKNCDTTAEIAFNLPLRSVHLCEMTEQSISALPIDGGAVNVQFGPFKIVTLRCQL